MKVCLVSMTAIDDDPRVRRQGDALAQAGYDVVAVGTGGAQSLPPQWPIVRVDARRRAPLPDAMLAARGAIGTTSIRASRLAYWSLGYNRRYLAAAKQTCADLYLANDWTALPIAAVAADHQSKRYAYDSHEFGVEENLQNRIWRAVMPGFIDRLERADIGGAAFVTTVAEGIADRLEDRYNLAVRPTVIRNVPAFSSSPVRVARPPYTVLYQGIFNPNRALDVLIESVRLWRPEFRLVVRGVGSPSETDRLKSLAARSGGRVAVEPPVSMTDMVPRAAEADIGVFALPASNPQADYCLPNKLFEYTMAGLAVCVTDLPEMRRVVELHGIGVLIGAATPEGIASAINELTEEAIDRFRANARRAAAELCWDTEQLKFLALVDSSMSSG